MANDGVYFLYPLIFIILVGVFLNLLVAPFTDDNLPMSSETSPILRAIESTVFYLGFIIPDSIQDFFQEQLTVFSYLPLALQNIIFIIIGLSLAYAGYMLLPFT
jgi:hypothetical protein